MGTWDRSFELIRARGHVVERGLTGEELSRAEERFGIRFPPDLSEFLCGGHRYLPAEPLAAGNPVFSIHQTDVIYYGHDLASYVEAEWGLGYERAIEFDRVRPIRFWGRLEELNR